MNQRLLFVIIICTLTTFPVYSQEEFIKGVDLSTLLQIEENGGLFKENGLVKDPIQIFRGHDVNYVRLKIWHNPTTDYNNLSKILQIAQRIKEHGLKYLLDFHYSDTWADPANQTKPKAWVGLSFDELKDSIYSYTKSVVKKLKNNGILPNIIQIGNEIICGFLWNDGRICDEFNNQSNWQNFTDLLKEAIRGVREIVPSTDSLQIMIHIDRGADNFGSRWFFDNLLYYKINFEIIGLSYYPWWHGSLSDLQNNLIDLSERFKKKIVIAETAYPWTLMWNDNTNNLVGSSNQLLDGYEATIAGQKKFLLDVINITKNVSNGYGVFYWEPDWISTQTFGSPWENLALFDFSSEILPSVNAFETTLSNEENLNIRSAFYLLQNYPNPFNASTTIRFSIPKEFIEPVLTILKVYDIMGREVSTLVNEKKSAGNYSVEFDGRYLSSGFYFYRFKCGDFNKTKKFILLK